MSIERIDRQAQYLIVPDATAFGLEDARKALREGRFQANFPEEPFADVPSPSTWIAITLRNPAESSDAELRRVLGLGGIFVELPEVYLFEGNGGAIEILASQAGDNRPLMARYFTYIRTQSFVLPPGETRTILVNTTINDRPTIGIFREGDLGRNQIVGALVKALFTLTLLFVATVLAVVSIMTKRTIGTIVAIGFGLIMLQADASLLSTAFSATPRAGRIIWEALTLSVIFYCYYAFLVVFRDSLRLSRHPWLAALLVLLPTPLLWVAWYSDSTVDILWAFYLTLIMFALLVALRFDIARRLRIIAAGVMFFCVLAALLVEPYYLGRNLPDLTIEFIRDAIRMLAGLAMLFLVLVDVRRTRQERDRLTAERIAALEARAATDRQLLQTEREYARARDSAQRRKQQLAAASHDIRQPLIGLRGALREEADSLSPALQARVSEAIDYLEQLTNEYSDRAPREAPPHDDIGEEYPLDLVLRAVSDMFSAEARERSIDLRVAHSACRTRVPALALVRSTSNLVANALRHADASRIMVGVRHRGKSCIIDVLDNGRGMSGDELTRALQAGGKGEGSDGDGLGLAIIQELAERHDFDFVMESAQNKGTRARLILSAS
ncbi:ATP-binding protein [Altererythrobacter sp. GH1-8]|uniref:ATP-binding protein n=1 Tax=Altererythrobacter sp. GH1-8 TaxID=3349333 RepID=UPI00374D3BD6